MAGYRKRIAYLDYLENGMKIKNAGFVKVEERGTQIRLEMRVKDVPDGMTGEYELKADGGGSVAMVSMSRGYGNCCIVWDSAHPGAERAAKEVGGIYVSLPGRRLIQAVWQEPVVLYVKAEGGTTTSDVAADSGMAEKEALPAYQMWENVLESPLQISSGQPERAEGSEFVQRSEPVRELEFAGEAEPAREPEHENEPDDQPQQEPVCYGDKWEQLLHTYPVIHPFDDEREYLSIAPKDFIVLRKEYQKMVHNSFLLHGYYNYRHLILGRLARQDGWEYYLGVPGNFYNREKMVAEMFGFEAFEGIQEPAKPGDFGYFMKRVEI